MSKQTNNKKSDNRKRNAALIIAIIVILLSITSCSAITYFGKIGKYTKESTIEIDDTTGDKKINKNDKLTFDLEDNQKTTTIDMKDGDYKLSFSIKNISPDKYTCKTDNASIATCIVEDGYVRIKPKKKGKVLVTLSTEVNNKRYIATTTIKITGTKKSSKNNSDEVKVNVDDSKAKQTQKSNSKNSSKSSNSKNSNVKNSNGKSSNDSSSNSNSNDNTNNSNNSSNNNTNTDNNDNNDTNTDNDDPVKSSDATLKSLSVTGYALSPTFDADTLEYTVEVGNDITSVNINAKANSNKATITSGKGNVELTSDTTTVKVKVKAEDGTTKTYTIVINKTSEATNTLSSLSVTGYSLNKTFDKNTLEYELTEELDFSVDELDINYTKTSSKETVEVIGNTGLIAGETNTIKVVVTALNGDQRIYKIKAKRKENLDYYNISSTKTFYDVGYRYNHDLDDLIEDTIIVNSNILDGEITTSLEEGKLILKDNYGSTIILESDMDLSYIVDTDTNSHAIKVNYKDALDTNNSANKTIKVSGYRKGTQIGSTYEITFNINRIYYVTLDVSGLDENNKGFFYEDENTYKLNFYAGEELDLNDYKDAYKKTDTDNCKVYTLGSYNTSKNGSGTSYPLNSKIQINSDLVLYGIYDESGEPIDYVISDKRLYLSDVDIFETENGDKVISPGTKGSYIMHIKNTSSNTIILKTLDIEEESVCVDNVCLNIGYIAKRIDVENSTDSYLIGGSNSNYETIKDTHSKSADIKDSSNNYIEIAPEEEVEITILWKWLDDDENDTKIGEYAANSTEDIYYYLTVSYSYDIKSTECQV